MNNLTTEQMRKMNQQDRDLTVINVLDKEHFNKEHIPGSVNVPVSDDGFEDHVREIAGDRNGPVVVYCASKDCDASPKAASKLEAAGFSSVYDYEGGMKAWREANLPVEARA